MPRYTLYRANSGSASDVASEVRSAGGSIIVAKPGLALIEASEAVAETLRQKLKDWKVSPEKTARIPSPRPHFTPG